MRHGKILVSLSLAFVLLFGMTSVAEARGSSRVNHVTRVSHTSKYVNPNHGPTHIITGYTKKAGTKVAPYKRTYPNHTKKDNLRYHK
ncbi:hypothetical protein [Desulfitobacterium sp.]|uniref:hypothetical protein n=1 Tax=Desulfitobacterium sp. TaxID=49981 RepID=UPI002B625E02|nr:hypothetical protein [Desulfitobacterium sp.]HVJ49444.1 hypothetical protein [Desulfitobacterium sp.]